MNIFDKWYDPNEEFTFTSSCGTRFESTCSLRRIAVYNRPTRMDNYSLDLSEFIAYHSLNIWGKLNGFQGYDNMTFEFKD